ncbi:MAG: DUF3035 domain-containing protein [Geminicoccaceae bacterium]|nr:DUF3035 domain-containing protein [Geminicoccaceae bacterium]
MIPFSCIGRSSARGVAGAVLASALLLAGCSGTVQEKLGMGARAPDEFQVVRRAPLVMPPDYRLRPPGEIQGSARRTVAQDAKAIVTGNGAATIGNVNAAGASIRPSAAERALLAAVPVEAQSGIREQLLEENTALTQLDESSFLYVLGWQRDAMTYTDPVIDPKAEAEQLRQGGGAAGRVTTERTGSRVVVPDEAGG